MEVLHIWIYTHNLLYFINLYTPSFETMMFIVVKYRTTESGYVFSFKYFILEYFIKNSFIDIKTFFNINPLKLNGNCVSHLLQQLTILHFVYLVFMQFSL
jgi:hypothetical protein